MTFDNNLYRIREKKGVGDLSIRMKLLEIKGSGVGID